MKKFLLSVFVLTLAVSAMSAVILSEVVDPSDYSGRFVEVTNAGAASESLSGMYVVRQANGGNVAAITLPAISLASGDSFVIANSVANLNTLYGTSLVDDDVEAMSSGTVSGNGDDGFFLTSTTDLTGIVDAYGVAGEDGTGKDWEYENSKAVRNSNVKTANATWTSSEWTISAEVNSATPGTHTLGVSDWMNQ